MKREQRLAHKRRRLEVREDVGEEMAGIGVGGVARGIDSSGPFLSGTIVVHDNLVDVEDREGASYSAGNGDLLIGGEGTNRTSQCPKSARRIPEAASGWGLKTSITL